MRLSPAFSRSISTHAPAGGATTADMFNKRMFELDFYSRPCGRGDSAWDRFREPKLRDQPPTVSLDTGLSVV